MRGKIIHFHHFKQILCQNYSLLGFEPSGTVASCLDLSGHLGLLVCPGKLRHFRDDPLACWHTSGMLAHWNSRQTHGTGSLIMTHRPLNLVDFDWNTQMWSVSQFQVSSGFNDE